MSLSAKIYAIIFAIVCSFGAGCAVTNWHRDSNELVAQKAAEKVAKDFQVDQQAIANNVVKSLDIWRQTNVITNEKITREKLQPVFANQCVTADYVGMFNDQTNRLTSGPSKPVTKAGN